MPTLGLELSEEVLDRRAILPRKPSAVTLGGTIVELVPLEAQPFGRLEGLLGGY